MKFWRATATVAAVVASGFVAAGPSGDNGTGDSLMVLLGHDQQVGYGPARFDLHGQEVRGLYPGVTRQMHLTLANPYRFRLRISDISGRAEASTRRGCSPTPANLRVVGHPGRLPVYIGAYGRTTLPDSLSLTMPPTAAQLCAGTRFTIALTGHASRADR